MENLIPTAEEFFIETTGIQIQGKNNYYSEIGGISIENSKIYKFAIDFAKLHVEAALKRASRKADYKLNGQFGAYQKISINRKEILNSYPLTNIK